MNLIKKLELWTAESLLSEAQKNAIIEFESKPKNSIILYAMLFVSCFCIGLGFISIIASNWQIISPQLKLAVDFILLASIASGVYYSKINGKPLLMEAFLIFYAIFILASIGLVAQIFQLPPNGLTAVLFWSVLIIPLMYLSKKPLLSLIWIPTFIVSSIDLLNNFYWFKKFMSYFIYYFRFSPTVLFFLCILIFVLFYCFVLKKYFSSSMFSNAFRNWTLILMAFYVLVLENVDRVNSYAYNMNVWEGIFIITLTGALYIYNKHRNNEYWDLALLTLATFTLIVNIRFVSPDILGAFSTISILALIAVYGYKTNNIQLINLTTILITIRFFYIYIQVFGSLLNTGFGLLLSGVVFLVLSYSWNKYRQEIVTKMKEQKSWKIAIYYCLHCFRHY